MDVRRFDLNLLMALDALLSERNVTRAGQRLGLSQSAMSGLLARLRQLLHDQLLVRVGRQLQLTPFAEELVGQVRECVQRIEDVLNRRGEFDPKRDPRTFNLAISDYATYLLFAPLMKRLGQVAPQVTVNFVATNPAILQPLQAGKLDFVIMPSQMPNQSGGGAPSAPLFSDRWTCAVWSRHPTVDGKLSESEFLELPHLAFKLSGSESGSVADNYLDKLGLKRHVVAFAGAFALIPFLLRGTNFIALLQRRLAERVRRAAEIKLVEPPFELPDLQERIFWNPRFSADPAHLWMRAQLEAVVREL